MLDISLRRRVHRNLTIRYGSGHLEGIETQNLGPTLRNNSLSRATAWALRIATEKDEPIGPNDKRVNGLQIISPTTIFSGETVWFDDRPAHRDPHNPEARPNGEGGWIGDEDEDEDDGGDESEAMESDYDSTPPRPARRPT